MFLFGHLGFAAAPGTLAVRRQKIAPQDLRWFLAGSILPDLVDKAVGQFIFKSRYENGRIYCHTILFTSLSVLYGGKRARERQDDRVLLLGLGAASHLALDEIWMEPETAFWPFLGPFLREPSSMSLLQQLLKVMKDPFFWLSETGGAVLLLGSLRGLGIRDTRALRDYILSGKVANLSQAIEAN
jgi:inner membrane protein